MDENLSVVGKIAALDKQIGGMGERKVKRQLSAMQKHNIALYGEDFYGNTGDKSEFGKVNKSQLAKAEVNATKSTDAMLANALKQKQAQLDDPYRAHGLNIDKSVGDTLGSIYDALSR